jgi:hypothetical protein
MKEIKRYKIRLPKYPNLGIQRSDGYFSESYDKDFYINIPIFKEHIISDYVNVFIDPSKLEIERQFINPYYIELGFFKNVSSILKENSINKKSVEEKSYNYNLKINGLPLIRKNQLEDGELEFEIPEEENLIFLFKIERMGLVVNRNNNTLGRNITVYIRNVDRLRITNTYKNTIVGKAIEIRNTPHIDGKYNVTAIWKSDENTIGAFYLNSENNEKFYEDFIIDDSREEKIDDNIKDRQLELLEAIFPGDGIVAKNAKNIIREMYESLSRFDFSRLKIFFPNKRKYFDEIQNLETETKTWHYDTVSAQNGKVYLIK